MPSASGNLIKPEPELYTLDFAKFCGKTLEEVEKGGDSAYIRWLIEYNANNRINNAVDNGIDCETNCSLNCDIKHEIKYENYTPLEIALENYIASKPAAPSRPVTSRTLPDPEAAGEFVMSWGKHRGEKLSEIPNDYLLWVINSDTDQDVRDALQALGLKERTLIQFLVSRRPIGHH